MGTLLCLAVGYFVGELFLSSASWDWVIVLLAFICLPVIVAALGFYIGWYGKKSTVDYTDPTWQFAPVQLEIDDAQSLVKQNRRTYWRMVSNSSYWTFFLPIVLLLFMAGLPVYMFIETPDLGGLESWIFGLALSLTYAVASIGALLATSNAASEDFNILLVREAIALAKVQEKIPGISNVRIVLDKAKLAGYEIYEAPRVVSRIRSIERDAYVESWSDDLHAVTRVLCRLHESENSSQVIWWWISQDRNFRKFVGADEKGYYVQLPVQSRIKHPGVKDIDLVFKNAVAILILEWLKTRGEKDELREILEELDAVPIEG